MLAQKDTKWKKYIGDFTLVYDHYSGLINIYYEDSLMKVYDAKVSEAEEKFSFYEKELQRIVEKKKK